MVFGALLVLGDGTNATTVLIVLATTLLVGIGEETAFRGLVLNSLASRMPVVGAVGLSGALFGLLHAVNVIIAPVESTLVQIVVTTMLGITLGFVYVASGGNLVLVIVSHWLYDFSLIAPVQPNPFAIAGPLLVVSFVIALAVGIVKYRRVRRWPQDAG